MFCTFMQREGSWSPATGFSQTYSAGEGSVMASKAWKYHGYSDFGQASSPMGIPSCFKTLFSMAICWTSWIKHPANIRLLWPDHTHRVYNTVTTNNLTLSTESTPHPKLMSLTSPSPIRILSSHCLPSLLPLTIQPTQSNPSHPYSPRFPQSPFRVWIGILLVAAYKRHCWD